MNPANHAHRGIPARHHARWVAALACTTAAGAALAAPVAENEVWKGVFSSFATPLDTLINGTAEESVSWRFSIDQPLALGASAAPGSGTSGSPSKSATLGFGFKYTPLTSWFLAGNFSQYLRPELKKPWNPDFTYAFGYDDWHPYTLSVQYANYGGNRLRPHTERGEKYTYFKRGTWNLGFKFPLPEMLEGLLLRDAEDAVGCNTGLNYTPEWSDGATNSVKTGKRTLALGCKYGLKNNLYFNFGITKYLIKGQQQTSDPDFTYGFGYFDWRPGAWSVQYNNFSGNRFPWHPKAKGTGTFRDGSISISTSGNLL
jgi:hypothetical protein